LLFRVGACLGGGGYAPGLGRYDLGGARAVGLDGRPRTHSDEEIAMEKVEFPKCGRENAVTGVKIWGEMEWWLPPTLSKRFRMVWVGLTLINFKAVVCLG